MGSDHPSLQLIGDLQALAAAATEAAKRVLDPFVRLRIVFRTGQHADLVSVDLDAVNIFALGIQVRALDLAFHALARTDDLELVSPLVIDGCS